MENRAPPKKRELIAILAANIKKDCGVAADAGRLDELIDSVGLAYDGDRYWEPEIGVLVTDDLHKLDKPLRTVIAVLANRPKKKGQSELRREMRAGAHRAKETNFLRACGALMEAGHPDVADRLWQTIEDLEVIRTAAAHAHRARPRGNPKDEPLYDLVRTLADYWENELGLRFSQAWHTESTGKHKGQRKPTTPATRFAYGVVEFVDPDRLGELPTVTKNVAAERRRDERQRAAKLVAKIR